MPALYDLVGGQPFFDALVDRFYAGVEADPRLRSMYPDDLAESKLHLALFLGQYWGGPGTYMELRGHPRLRLRHVPFVVDEVARDAWVEHMVAAVRSAEGLDPEHAEAMVEYFEHAATFLINSD